MKLKSLFFLATSITLFSGFTQAQLAEAPLQPLWAKCVVDVGSTQPLGMQSGAGQAMTFINNTESIQIHGHKDLRSMEATVNNPDSDDLVFRTDIETNVVISDRNEQGESIGEPTRYNTLQNTEMVEVVLVNDKTYRYQITKQSQINDGIYTVVYKHPINFNAKTSAYVLIEEEHKAGKILSRQFKYFMKSGATAWARLNCMNSRGTEVLSFKR